MEWIKKVDRVEQKIQRLAETLNRLRAENAGLLDENEKLKAKMAAQTQKINELKDNLDETQRALKKRQEKMQPEGSGKLNKQIDQYIREIDKCIEWLQNA